MWLFLNIQSFFKIFLEKKIVLLWPILIFNCLLNKMSEKKISKKSVILTVLGVTFLIAAGIGFWGYRLLYAPDFNKTHTVYLYIDQAKDFEKLCRQLVDSAGCERIKDFKILAKQLKYPENMKTGRYAVEPGMNHLTLINHLRRGQQAALRITFNNIRFKEDLAARLDDQLMLTKEDILQLISDSAYTGTLGFTPETISAMFLPDTYEVYWNISPENLIKRMKREFDNFWTEQRKAKAAEIGLTPIEVSVLASIVEEETATLEEYPIVAGLYINRLHRGIPLQADPTVKFAMGDFSLQRILFTHLEIDSPYNTYKYAGLPPGPLRMPSVRGLDAVLNYTRHNYLYMCAKEDFSGRHNFAVTLAEHNRNADRYRAELNRRRIR